MSKTTILYKDIAPGAEDDASVTAVGAEEFSAVSDLPQGVEPAPVISLEHNYWALDGTFQPMEGQPIAFWSSELSGEDGTFTNPPVITIEFSKQYSSVGVTLAFDRAGGGYCTSVHIQWYQGTALKSEKTFAPDGTTYFCENRVESWDKIVITLNSTNLPGRRAKLEQIIFGILRTFTMRELRSAAIVNEMDLVGLELPVSTFNFTLDVDDDVEFMFQLKQPVEVRNNDTLLGVYYIDAYSRTSQTVYPIECYDAIGVLDETPFPGGAYLSGISAKELLKEIVGEDFSIMYAPDVADTTLTGILEPMSKREAIQHVLFAWGVQLATDGTDSLKVFLIPTEAEQLPMDDTYTGVSVDTSAIVTKVSVTAHTYAQASDGDVEIAGVKYKDTQTVYSVTNPNVTANTKQNVKEISDAMLVSTGIGQAVAQRVYNYYLRRNTNKAKIVWKGQRLGDCLTIQNAWGGNNTGHLARMEIRLSNTVAANCETVGE